MTYLSYSGAALERARTRLCRPVALLGVVLGAFIASTLGLYVPVAQAQNGPQPFMGFLNPNKVVLANSPSKVAYLGAGTGDTSWVTRYSDTSWVGSEFGFDPERTDLETFRSTIPYAKATAFKNLLAKGRIVDMVSGFVGEYNGNEPEKGRDVIAVVVLEVTTPGGSIAYEVHALGPMDEAFPNSIKVLGTGTGRPKPKIALANQSGPRGQRTATILVTTKSDDGQLGFNQINSYRVSFITTPGLPSLIPNIPTVVPVQAYRTDAGQYILDIAHRPGHEGLFHSASSPTAPGQLSAQDQIFLTAQALQKGPGTDRKYRPVVYAHVLGNDGQFLSHTRLNTQAVIGQTGIGPTELQVSDTQIRSGNAFNLLYDVFLTNDSGKPGYFMALRSNDRVALAYYDPGFGLVQAWRWSNAAITQCEDPNGGIDFRAFQPPAALSGGRFNANNVQWRLVCVKPNTDLGLGSNARLGVEATSGAGINLGNNNMVTRAFGHMGLGGIERANYGYSNPQVFLEFPCLEILHSVDVYRPTVAEDDGDAVEFRGDECSAMATEVTKGNKDDGITVGSPGNVSFTVLAAVSGGGALDRRLAPALALLHATYAVAEKTTEVVQTKVDVGMDGKKKKKDEEVEVTAFAGAPYIGSLWPVVEAPTVVETPTGTLINGQMRTLARLPADSQVLTVDLDAKFDTCRQGPNFKLGNKSGNCNAATVLTKPIPVAALFAPPFVANSGQEPNTYASTYGRTRDSETAEAKTTGGTANFSVGVKFTTPVSDGSFTAGFETAIGQSVGSSRFTSLTTGFLPAASGDDYVVLQTTSNYLFTGQVTYASDGFGFPGPERPYELYVPYKTGTALRTWAFLQTDTSLSPYFAAGRPGSLYPGFAKLFSHVAGDPGSFPEYENDAGRSLYTQTGDDARCLGLPFPGFDPTKRVVRRRNSPALNAFIKSNLPSADPEDVIADSVLISDESAVPAQVPSDEGFSNQAFAEISLGVTAERSYHEDHTVSFDFEAAFGPEIPAVGGVRFQANFGSSVSQGIEQSYTTGEGSQFESAVSDLPFLPGLFPDEENYGWRLYLCTADIGTAAGLPPLPISVLGFTVNDYNGLGTNRFEPLGDITPIYPLGTTPESPAQTSRNPQIIFNQPEGTIMSYNLSLTNISNSQSCVQTYVYCDAEPIAGTETAKAVCGDVLRNRPDRVMLPTQTFNNRPIVNPPNISCFKDANGRDKPLDKNTTYRYLVTGIDHRGNTVNAKIPGSNADSVLFFRTNSDIVPGQADITVTSTSLAFTEVKVAPPISFNPISVIETRLLTRYISGPGVPVPVAGQTVTVTAIDRTTFAATTVCTAVTNADGRARCTFSTSDPRTKALRSAGSLRARYAGNLAVPPYGGADVTRGL